MRTIRRFYFYLVAFISLEVVLWGVIGLARTIFNGSLTFSSGETLALALALLLVGTPIFLIHWLWAQRAAAHDVEEKTASLRAVFFYAALLATLVPLTQNVLALLNRLALQAARLEPSRAIFGGQQTTSDNLLAALLNLLVGAYFWNVLRGEWKTLPEKQDFADTRRLYRHLWLVYSLLMLIFGAEKILAYLFNLPFGSAVDFALPELINGLALALVGAPLWAFTWQSCQRALSDELEQGSSLRLGALFLLTLTGIAVSLGATGNILYQILRAAFLGSSLSDTFRLISGTLSLALPLGTIWAYYGSWFSRESNSAAWKSRRAGIRRLYVYILSAAGLTATIIGIMLLLSFLVDLTLNGTDWGDLLGERLAALISTLLVGLPLWLSAWRPMQAEAAADGESGDSTRGSLIRRFYLYAAIFASVIGSMISAGGLAYSLLRAGLTGETGPNFWSDTLTLALAVALFVTVLVYHSLCLRRDSGRAGDTLAARRKEFRLLAISSDAEAAFGARLTAALQRQSADLALTVLGADEALPADSSRFGALALPADLALNPPPALKTWLETYPGFRVLVPPASGNWLWAGESPRRPEERAAQILRQLAEGETPRPSFSGNSAWTVVAYVFAALFGLQILFGALMLMISLLTNF